MQNCYNCGILFDPTINSEIFKHLNEKPEYATGWMAEYWGEPEWCQGYGVRNTHRCVTGDTKILTIFGNLPIKDFIGEQVRVWNGFEWSDVTPFPTGRSKIMRVTFSNGMHLDCTEDHQFMVLTAQRLSDSEFPNAVQTVTATELRIGDCLPKFNNPGQALSNGVHVPYAYTSGLFCGDGNISNSAAGKYPRKELRLYGEKIKLSEYVEWKSKKTWGDGCIRGYLPDGVLDKYVVPHQYSIESKLEWLAGLIDSDGSSGGKGICISMKDQPFAKEVALLVQSLGGEPSVTTCSRKGGYKGGGEEYYQVVISMFSLGNSWLSVLPTKRVKINTTKVKTRASKTRFPRVVKIERLEEQETFCFTEKLRGYGVFNGVLTKQCAIAPNTTSALICGSVSQGFFTQ